MESKNNHGGKRQGAGRKIKKDKKASLVLYPFQSRIILLGLDTIKYVANTAIEKEFNKRSRILRKR